MIEANGRSRPCFARRVARATTLACVIMTLTTGGFATPSTEAAETSASPFAVTPDVVYGHKAGMALTYDVIENRDASNGAAVMFMMSGGWVSGWIPPETFLNPLAPAGFRHFRELVQKGYTLVIVRHGSSPYFKVPDAVADVRKALAHLSENADRFGIDPDRIGVCGGSAGGHLALMLGTAPVELDAPDAETPRDAPHAAAVVAYFPPTDLREYVGPSESFPALEFDPDLAPSVSPLMHVSGDDPPTLLIHGDKDELVPLSHSERIHQAFQLHGIPDKLIVMHGAGHGFVSEQGEQASKELVAWFDRFLSPRGPDNNRALETPLNDGPTALDRYVAAPDDTYQWNTIQRKEENGLTTYIIDLTSQRWLTEQEVDRPVWKHWLIVARPHAAKKSTALMFVSGGSNRGGPPTDIDDRIRGIALATNSVVAEIKMIPNQPLVFHQDGVPRVEDDLIGYTWDQYLKTGDARWPARLPMVKSVVRAMDTVQQLLREEDAPSPLEIEKFVVAGGSKRGWTTWMVAAVDKRVAAIAPIVIDVLNVDRSMQHHYAAYGFWAPAIGNYVQHKVPHRRFWPRYRDLLQLVDPYAYRDRLTMPKCIISATGDEFFVPDSSQFYFDRLPGEKHLCYVPNGNHSLGGTNALDTLVAFHWAIVNDVARPKYHWSYPGDRSIRVTCETPPKKVLLWHATNPSARDFRVDTIGRAYRSVPVEAQSDGSYLAEIKSPEQGWTAFFVQMVFDIGAPTPLRLTTPVRITPTDLPFADKVAPVIPLGKDSEQASQPAAAP